MNEDEVLTKEELAKFLKVTERTVDRMRDEGMPYFKIGSLSTSFLSSTY